MKVFLFFFLVFFFNFTYLFSKSHSLNLHNYLTKKGYRYLNGLRQPKDGGNITFSQEYSKSFTIKFLRYSKVFKINDYTYFLKDVPQYGRAGMILNTRDGEFFKQVVDYYESKYFRKQDRRSSKKIVTSAKKLVESQSLPLANKSIIKKKLAEDLVYQEPESGESETINYIFLDAGHGGKDPGAVFYGFKEKQLALQATLELRDLLKESLEKAGKATKIILTRSTDKFVSLELRSQIANSSLKENQNGLFISIHFNIWINPKSRGLEIYYLSHDKQINQERVYSHLEDISLLTQSHIKSKNSLVGEFQNNYLKKIFSYLEVVQYQRESYFLASKMTDKIQKNIKNYPIRGKSNSDIFYVLRGALMPSALLELGFISNRADMEFFNSLEKRQELLASITSSIVDYISEFESSNGFKQGLFIEKTLESDTFR